MKLERFELRSYSLVYSRPVHWFNSSEDRAQFVALRVFSEGATGVAEVPFKPTWTGLSVRSTVALVSDLYLPALHETDLTDFAAVQAALAVFPGNQTAKMLVLNACATLRAAATGIPLWQSLGGKDVLDLSWCVTRQQPVAMANEAEAMVARHGFGTLKVKGGQGFDTDRSALRLIRDALGEGVTLTVDANGAYSATETPDYVRMIADEGVVVAEDPCPLAPDDAFTGIVEACALPILVDSPCISVVDARAFLDAGAGYISVKPGRVGIPEAIAVAELARSRGAKLCTGLFAESALGSLLGLQFSAAVSEPFLPAEQSFYLLMSEQILHTLPEIQNGQMQLPSNADLDALADWSQTDLVETG